MLRGWRQLTGRGRMFLLGGLAIVVAAMLGGQRDVMRLGLLLVALLVLAYVLAARARLRMTCERSVQPARVPLGSVLHGQLTIGQEGRLPTGLLLLEDNVPSELGHRPRFLVDRGQARRHRVVEYPMLGRVRGRFATGPLRVRTTDPFGLVQLHRTFAATSEVMVTPHVVPLANLRTAGGGGSTGEARPNRIGVVGQDDALVRDYRQGDDVRRIHWRSTARRGELMVRREEQAWDPSATIVLDSRAGAHAGEGMQSSLEWAISAAASIAVHLLDDGFSVEIFEADGPLQINAGLSQHSSVTADLVVSRLTDLRARTTTSLRYAGEVAAAERAGQLVIAVLGRMTADDAQALLRLRRNRSQGFVLLLDVDSYAEEPASQQERNAHELAARILRDNQWRVLDVGQGMGVAAAWAALEQLTAVG